MERLHRIVTVWFIAAVAAVVMLAAGGQPALAATTGSVLVSTVEFHPTSELSTFRRFGAELWGTGTFVARLKVPSGATATALEVYYWDNHASQLCVDHVAEAKSSDPTITWTDLSGPVCTAGAMAAMRTLVVPLTANRILASEVLYVTVGFPVTDPNLRISGAKVKYRRP